MLASGASTVVLASGTASVPPIGVLIISFGVPGIMIGFLLVVHLGNQFAGCHPAARASTRRQRRKSPVVST